MTIAVGNVAKAVRNGRNSRQRLISNETKWLLTLTQLNDFGYQC